MSKVLGIQEESFFKLVERMNAFNAKNKVIATQVFPPRNSENYEDSWYALVYYEDSNSQRKESDSTKATSFQPSSGGFIPPTKRAVDYLVSLGFKGNTSKMSKSEVWKETKKLKEKK